MKAFNIAIITAALLCLPALSPAVEVGSAAPHCALQSFDGTAPIDLSRYRGKVVYLDFWASWCGPCAQSMPFMDELEGQLGAKGFQVLAVNLDENRDEAAAFLGKHPVKLTVAADPEGECPGRFGVQIMPSSYLIDRKGNIRHIQLGFRKDDSLEIRRLIEQLLAEG
jgi:thiol-disulfide isomerase/thioredoxin